MSVAGAIGTVTVALQTQASGDDASKLWALTTALIIVAIGSGVLFLGGSAWRRWYGSDAPKVVIEDDSLDANLATGQRPMWRLKVRNDGSPVPLALYVERLTGTGQAEEGYFPKWRLHEQRYIAIGEVPQTVDIAQVSDDSGELDRAILRLPNDHRASALDFFSSSMPNGTFPRQVSLNGSLQAVITALGEDGAVYARARFGLVDDGVGPQMRLL